MKTIFVISAVLAAFFCASSFAAPDKVVCYYGSWAVYRQGLGKFDVEQIDPTLCTHLIYTFVGVGEDGSVKVLDPWNDLEDNWGKGAFKRFVKLKERNPAVKTLIAIGGWNEGGARFSAVVGSDALRATFVRNIVDFVKKYNFDGFDLDWEYPANTERGGKPEDRPNFSKLLKELRAAFDPEGLLLTAAVAAPENAITTYYEVPELSKYLDFINVMTYDIHGSWEKETGENAPLYPASIDTSPYLNVKACIEGWIRQGAAPEKIVLGMGTYGRSFTLAEANQHGLGAPTYGGGNSGPYTNQMGMLGYNEIVEKLRDGELTVVWNEEQQVPYAYGGNQWVGYDDPKSIKVKCEFAKQMNLGGGMIWSLETDDFHGVSGETFPLLKTINRSFGRQV